jgi:hypothetical protein
MRTPGTGSVIQDRPIVLIIPEGEFKVHEAGAAEAFTVTSMATFIVFMAMYDNLSVQF